MGVPRGSKKNYTPTLPCVVPRRDWTASATRSKPRKLNLYPKSEIPDTPLANQEGMLTYENFRCARTKRIFSSRFLDILYGRMLLVAADIGNSCARLRLKQLPSINAQRATSPDRGPDGRLETCRNSAENCPAGCSHWLESAAGPSVCR